MFLKLFVLFHSILLAALYKRYIDLIVSNIVSILVVFSKRRPQNISPRSHVINRDAEVNDLQHFKVVRQGSNTSDSIPAVSTNGIAEIPPAEKVKA